MCVFLRALSEGLQDSSVHFFFVIFLQRRHFVLIPQPVLCGCVSRYLCVSHQVIHLRLIFGLSSSHSASRLSLTYHSHAALLSTHHPGESTVSNFFAALVGVLLASAPDAAASLPLQPSEKPDIDKNARGDFEVMEREFMIPASPTHLLPCRFFVSSSGITFVCRRFTGFRRCSGGFQCFDVPPCAGWSSENSSCAKYSPTFVNDHDMTIRSGVNANPTLRRPHRSFKENFSWDSRPLDGLAITCSPISRMVLVLFLPYSLKYAVRRPYLASVQHFACELRDPLRDRPVRSNSALQPRFPADLMALNCCFCCFVCLRSITWCVLNCGGAIRACLMCSST